MRHRENGFTLLEVLIAFVIFSIVLVSVYASFATSLRGEAEAQQARDVIQTARTIFAEVGEAIELSEGEYSGREEDRINWTLIIHSASPAGTSRFTGQVVQLFELNLTLEIDEAKFSFEKVMLGQVDE